MALLALTLALLAMTVTTVAITLKPLDMALDSFDDQYQGCVPAMRAELPALNCSEFENNPLFAKVWPKAVAKWQSEGSPVSPLSSSAQAIAIMAYTMSDLYRRFNKKVREAGRSPQEYRDNFHFKTLHFLLTNALATLRAAQGQQCRWVYRGVRMYKFKAKVGDIVRFGQFASSTIHKNVSKKFGTTTMFKVKTCQGADIQAYSYYSDEAEVLIPPFEEFKVTKVIEKGEKVEIHLDSIGTYSKYNCEWLRGAIKPGDMKELSGHGDRNIHDRMGVSPGPLPSWRTPPGHHSPGSGHWYPLNHDATKVTEVTVVTVATMTTVAT
ncbi:erythroblast NAD(P)(+)--arginine ADP-ribosyltransferase-like [Catharus ustulatus]|uniref:erythroblast NAD(P)(+)--arginine ADP-ribosyltransferase-like n=1 Tax=Catharus ustulatus TaxID=91951 RepID=UPI00140883F0|nr:erythroblast NAD(P)(+)--arginine ADP-ribosyltransferase-like [Catharus ustulatus]